MPGCCWGGRGDGAAARGESAISVLSADFTGDWQEERKVGKSWPFQAAVMCTIHIQQRRYMGEAWSASGNGKCVSKAAFLLFFGRDLVYQVLKII